MAAARRCRRFVCGRIAAPRALPLTLLLLVLPPLLGVAPAWAAAGSSTDESVDDVLGGFDDDDFPTPTPSASRPDPNTDDAFTTQFWELAGDVSLGASYNFLDHSSATGSRYGNLSRLRVQLDLQLDLRLPGAWKARIEGYGFYDFAYRIHGRSNYTDDVLEDYEWEVDFKDVWIQGSVLDSLDVKVGRQIVNWGRSDTVRVLDILNPLDSREPGLVDIEDLRLPVAMLRLDYYPRWVPKVWGTWSVQGLVIPEYRQDRNPSFGSDFNPFSVSPPTSETPPRFGAAPEYGGSINAIFPGWDLSLYAARVYENRRFVVAGLKGDAHVTMVGAGGNATSGNWLFKAEAGFFAGIEYPTSSPLPGRTDKSRLDVMGGVEYYGFEDVQIAFEVVNRHIFGFESGIPSREDQIEAALRCNLDLLNARLHVRFVGFILGAYAQDGSVIRAEASYDLRDALILGGGIVLYQNGDSVAFQQIDRNDRLFLRLEYSF